MTVLDLLYLRLPTDEEIDAMERRFNEVAFVAEMAPVVERFEVEERFGYETARIADLRSQKSFWADVQAHEVAEELRDFLRSVGTDFAQALLREMYGSKCFIFPDWFYDALRDQQSWGEYKYDRKEDPIIDWFDDDQESIFFREAVW